MPAGMVTYGKDFVPWNSYFSTGSGSVTSGTFPSGAWSQVTASCASGFYPLQVLTATLGTQIAFPVEVGYGPAGAERSVAQGLSGVLFPVPGNLIPEGSRVVARAAAPGGITTVMGVKASAWAPDPRAEGARHKPASPQSAQVTLISASYTDIVSTLTYPFVLTHAYIVGATGAADLILTVAVGAAGAEVPIAQYTVPRGDNLGQAIIEFKPRMYPIPAGQRLSGKLSSGSYKINTSGYRLDY